MQQLRIVARNVRVILLTTIYKHCAMNKYLLAAGLSAALLSSASAAEFNVGPYKLGMTNAQAAKHGLTDCKETWDAITCKPLFPSLDIHRSSIVFDPKTKRVVEIVATMTHFPFKGMSSTHVSTELAQSRYTDEQWFRMAQDMDSLLRKSLRLAPCTSKLMKYDDYYTARKTEDCHVLPDQTRTIMFGYNNTYSGSARHRNDPHVTAQVKLSKGWEAKAFVRQQKEATQKLKKEADLQAFQNGR
jgi:hypothetical protein